MIKTLYPIFQQWSDGGSVYILSDPHFNDPETKLMDKNWPDAEEEVKIINSIVQPKDTFVCLGDVGDISFVKKIRTEYKVLITGNHDKGRTTYKKKEEFINLNDASKDEIDNFKESGGIILKEFAPDIIGYKTNHLFDEVYTGPLFIADKILLSHEPVGLPFCLNIHGHDHNKKESYKDNCYYFNTAANVIGYKPINLATIIKGGALKNIRSIHRITIDAAAKH